MAQWKKILLGIAGFLTVLAGGSQVDNLIGAVSSRGNYTERTVLSAVAATTTGSAFNVADYALLGWTVSTANGVTGTVKFACSRSETAPTFSSSASVSNKWAYVAVIDSESGSTIAGNTGIAFTNSTTVRQFHMTDANYRWCTAVLSPWTNGTTTVTLLNASNQ